MSIKEITSDELKNKMDRGEPFILLDLLGEKSYQSLHLPQAIWLSTEDYDEFIKQVKELAGDDLEQTIIVYGASFKDERSTIKTAELLEAGFNNVLDFKGGLKDWAAELYPLEGLRAPK
ncbi:rhodanese-like domain-containing protein [Patescibacteria group bacterium]|nr:rhodanese-like domain-containing protein [Patescibacteria group bacterium]MBU1029394.1 rhodanese-like domain-containing protein [Patescibacteria group bacterium]MBU1915732.1 rhodanese-like domain-containing protein [Patescibacteria group bacterium]